MRWTGNEGGGMMTLRKKGLSGGCVGSGCVDKGVLFLCVSGG